MTTRSVIVVACVGLVLGVLPAAPSAPPDDKDRWEVLFDGKTLDAFDTTGHEGVWAVTAAGELYPAKAGRTLYAKKRYCDFVLEFECKMGGGKKANSGAFVRVHDPRPNEEVWTGLEVQILDNADYQIPFGATSANAALYGLAGPKVDANKPAGEWNSYRITAAGSVVTVELNAKEVVRTDLARWTKPGVNPDGTKNKFPHAIGALPREGFVGLQNYNATPVWFRGVRIKPLSDRQPKYTGKEAIDQVLAPPPGK
ncbi:MAG: hypothetical protein JWO38_4723 [Gemmataceae bacterium]|nr:hypothetical protein [Gemmataceae bacterium]